MQQKVVIKLPQNGKRSSCKAMQIAVGVPGVASAALAGEDKNHIEVTGDGIDSVALTMLLRKNVGFAELVSVAPVSEDNKSGDDQSESEKEVTAQIPWYYNYPYGYGPGHMYVIRDQSGEDNKSGDDQSGSEKEVTVQIPWYYNYPYGYRPGHMYVIRDQNPANCSIM